MEFSSHIETLTYETKRRLEFRTITKDIEAVVARAGIREGTVTIQTLHTTCRVWVNEDEKNLVGSDDLEYTPDLHGILDRFAPTEAEWNHNDIRDARNPNGRRDTHLCEPNPDGTIPECINGQAHAQALILQHAVTMIIENGSLAKGRWQEILLIELDHDRTREVKVLVQGVRVQSDS